MAILFVSAFTALLVGVGTDSPVRTTDLQVRAWVLAHHPDRVVKASTAFTVLADPTVSVSVLILVAAVLSWRRRSATPLVLAVLGGGALTTSVVALKALVHRAGPAPIHGHTPTGYFPSGHTTSAFLCYGLIALLLSCHAPHWRYVPAFRVGLAVASVVGAAMVYSNFHWLSDVLAGWALGATLIWLASAAAPRLLGSSTVPQPTPRSHQ